MAATYLPEANAASIDVGSLWDFVPAISPTFTAPTHLHQLADCMRDACAAARGEGPPVFVCSSIPPQHGKPLAADTLVTMADGTRRRIAGIRVGDRVVSGAGRITTVTAVFDQGELDTVWLTTRSRRRIQCESTHRFLTQDGWKRAGDLRPYDKGNWRRPRGDRLAPLAGYETDGDALTPDEARWLGYIVGDGGVSGKTLRFTNDDPVVVAEFTRLTESMGGSVRALGDGLNYYIGTGGKGRRIGPIRALLRRVGLEGHTSHTKFVPDEVFASRPDAVAAFLAAYFECDGTRARRDPKTGRPASNSSFTTVSAVLADGVQSLLTRLGIRSSLLTKRATYNGQPHTSYTVSVRDDRRFFEALPVIGRKAGPSDRERDHGDDPRLWDTVVSVEPGGRAHCYCITVADDESFLANDVVTHNTEFYLHSLAYWLLRQPTDFLAYLSYNQDIADDKSAKVRRYADLAGVDIRNDTRSKRLWRTTHNGGLLAGGIVGGSVTGREALRCLVIDDPYRNRADAESRVMRDKVWAEFNDSVWTRLHTGTSVFVNHTRWHPDDLIGRIKKDPELSRVFRFINFPVITRGGDPLHTDDYDVLWPEVQTRDLIKRKRQGSSDYAWWSLYMGEPRPRDTQVFSDGFGFFTEYPPHVRIAIGVDFAYTAKTSSDWSVAVVMATDGAERYYVLDVVRRQCAAPDFAAEIRELQRRYPGAPTMAYVGGTERGVVDYMAREGLRIDARPATTDKFLRAQPLSTAWNRGQVFLPDRPVSWREDFVACLLDFTGNNDPHDDDVDAAAAAFDALATAGVSGVYLPSAPSAGPKRMSRPKRIGRRAGSW